MINIKSVEEFIFHGITPQDKTVDLWYSSRVEKVVSYSVASPRWVSSGGGDGVFIALSKAFSVMTTFQLAGLVVEERVPSVRTLVNSSFTMVRTVWVEAEVDISVFSVVGLIFLGRMVTSSLFSLGFYFVFLRLLVIVQSASIIDVFLDIPLTYLHL
jgi:hypothetical protein